MAENEEELKSLLMKVEENEKAGLKLNVQKTKIMESGPITSWPMDEEKMETVADFIFLVSKITADSDCSHEIKRRFLFGRSKTVYEANTSLCQQRSRLKAMFFPVVTNGCESWTIKRAER